jgi:predicted MFS family arabinose efflux permease
VSAPQGEVALDVEAGPAPAAARVPVNYVVGLLFAVYLLNYLDRQIVNILAEPIKRDLALADWQLGLMTGLAFALFYTFLGIPLARYADRPGTNRSRLIAVCLAVWSAMTALCGLATGFVQLLAARIGVGVGEAGCSPAAHSLIADLVPRARRGSAMALYSLGIPLGKLIGMVIGGVVAQTLGWRVAFVAVGLPGLLLAGLTWFTLPVPPRPAAARSQARSSFADSLAALARVRTFWWISFGGAFMAFVSYGQTAFMGSFFMRVHGLSVGEAGVLLGLAFGLAGALGTWFGGRVCDKAAAHDPRPYVLIPAAAAAAGGLVFGGAVLMPGAVPALIGLSLAGALNAIWYGPVFATVHGLVPAEQRATAAAVHLFVINLIGLGLGPLAFGALSDLLNTGFALGPLRIAAIGAGEGLRWALLAGTGFAFLALVCFWRASRSIGREFAANADQS